MSKVYVTTNLADNPVKLTAMQGSFADFCFCEVDSEFDSKKIKYIGTL